MALVLNLRFVDHIKGKADRQAKCSFRGLTYNSKIVQCAKEAIYFGESFEWPIARELEPDETLEIQIVNFNKYLSNKVCGVFTLVLQALLEDGELKLCEPLVDENNRLLESNITFDVRYYSPDGKVGMWDTEEFQNPLTDYDIDELDDGTADSEAMAVRNALAETASLRSGVSSHAESLSNFGGDDEDEENNVARIYGGRTAKQEMMDQDLHKPRDFQICITIHEGTQLTGLNVDPVVRVQVGDEHKYSNIKQCTNTPYFNEYFVFDSQDTPIMLFDKMISLTVTDATGLPGRAVLKAANVVAGSIIGVFKCDVGTIYSAPDHQFYRKWAVLLNPDDISEGPKGYLKVDIAVVGKGDVPKPQKPDKDENNIEGNLLLPAGMPMERQKAAYRIVIHRAEDLPRMDAGIMASVKKAITMSTAFVDAYVRVSFLGHKGKTSVKKSYNPEWKEQLTFIDHFPPLSNRIKVQLIDQDALKDDIIATHFIELPQIMDPGGDTEGILPTYGPTWINFYGSPRNCLTQDDLDPLNDGIGEGAAYRGRLLIQIKTELLDADMSGPSTVSRDKYRTSTKVEVAPKKEFLLFSTLFDASTIDCAYKEKEVYFEITMGMAGNNLDKVKEKKSGMAGIFASSDTDSEDEDEESALITRQKKAEPPLPCRSSSMPMAPRTDDGKNFYIPIGKDKPCLYVSARFDDLRKRLHHSNLLSRMVEQLDEDLDECRTAIRAEKPHPHRLLRSAMDDTIKNCDRYQRLGPSLGNGAGAGKTKLDSHRLKTCKTKVDNVKRTAKKIKTEVNKENIKGNYREARGLLTQLKHIAKEPQHSLPDVIIWMIANKKRVAYHRIPARHLLHASMQELSGKYCGQMHNIFLKKPGARNIGSSGWAVQAKLMIYIWLGTIEKSKNKAENILFLSGLPGGYELPPTVSLKRPPNEIPYQEEHTFKLRAYLYQGRNLVGSDDSGLSDPFARVLIYNQCKETLVIDETLSPTWDEVLVFDDLRIQGDTQSIIDNPPLVIIEVYDYDTVGDPEFLGRSTLKPHIKLAETPYLQPDWPPRLEWVDVYRGPARAGEILTAVEMLQGYESEFMPLPEAVVRKKKKPPVIPLPMEIKPKLCRYRIEVMLWGLRELKRLKLLTVDRPRMDVECAGQILRGTKLEHTNKNCNFVDTVKYMDVEMPDDEHYWPPVTLRCIDSRSFGREVLVGTHTITNVQKYIYVSQAEQKRRQYEVLQKRQQRRQELLDRLNAELLGDNFVPNGNVMTDGGPVMPVAKSQSMMSLEGKKSKWEKAKDTMSLRSVFRSKDKNALSKTMSKSESNLAYGGAGDRMSMKSMPAWPADRHSMAYSVSSQGSVALPDNVSVAPSVVMQDGVRMQGMSASREPSMAPDQQSLAPSIMIEDETGRKQMADQSSLAQSTQGHDVSPDQISLAPSVMMADGQGGKQLFDSRAPSIAPDQSSIAPSVMTTYGQTTNMLSTDPNDPSPTPSGRVTRTPSPARSDQISMAPTIMTQDGEGMQNLFGSREPSMVFDAQSIGPAEDAEFLSRMGKARSVSRIGDQMTAAEQRSTADGVSMQRMFSTPLPSNYGDSVSMGQESIVTVRAAGGNYLREPSVHFSEFDNSRSASPGSGRDQKSIAPSAKSEGKKSLKSILSKGSKPGTPAENGAIAQTDCVIEMDNVPLVEGQTGPGSTQDPGAKPMKESKIKSTLMDTGKDGKKASKMKRKDLIADLDWWSKYYATKHDIEKKAMEDGDDAASISDQEESSEDESEDILDFNDEFKGLDYGDLDPKQLKALHDLSSADELDDDDPIKKKMRKNAEKKKKKQKKNAKKKAKMAKKKAKAKLKSMKGVVNKAFNREEEDEDEVFAETPEADKSHIERFKIYTHELEKVPAFCFDSWVQTFELYRGKKLGDEEEELGRLAGKFKGTMTIYKIDDEGRAIDDDDDDPPPADGKLNLRLSADLPTAKPYDVLIRLYIVKCMDLHPADLNGKADPYIIVKAGRKEMSDKQNKKMNTLNPVFGSLFEIDATFPMDSTMRIQVYDYDTFSADDLIGETLIDLENRFFSKHRAICGISNTYEIFGYNTWRDPMRPTQILNKLCKDCNFEPPMYSPGSCIIGDHKFEGPSEVEDEHGNAFPTEEHAALEALKNWEEVANFELVPEHIETRKLYIPEKPGVEQGRMEMWVDMFPKDAPTPTHSVDVTPRKPQAYELRVTIWNTEDVVLEDTNPITGEASSDIFIRGFLISVGVDDQSTDVHYRSMSGEGNFNWRFIFPFEYLKAEEKIIKKNSDNFLSSEAEEEKLPAKLTLQVWDADIVSADDYLGSIAMDLNKMPRPAKDSKRATMKLLRKDGSVPCFSLFKQQRCKGWWPMEGTDEDTGENTCVGKVEVELHLMTTEEAEKHPAGLAREAPDALPEPNRPDSSFLWFMNPLKTLKYIIWKNYKWLILKIFILLLIIAFLVLFFYSFPGAMVGSMFGG